MQKAQTVRSLKLMQEGPDFHKRLNGANSLIPEALHGDLDAATTIQREQPVHRTIINLSVAGYQNNEISQIVGRSPVTVANVLRQPWAREYITQQAKKTVQDEIRAVLEQEALPSIKKLVELRDAPIVSAAERGVALQASNALLDRFLGRPVQPMTTDAKPVAELSDEELKAQVARELAKSQEN